MLMGPQFRKKGQPEADMRVYTKDVDVAYGSMSSCAESVVPAAGCARGCPSVITSA